MADRPNNNYNCTQLELYAVCRTGLGSYRENMTGFNDFKALYDDAWGNTFEKEIKAAEELPSFQVRDEKTETLNIDLDNKADECTKKWRYLKRHVITAWDKQYHKPKLEAAGQTLYEKAASNNWEICKGLMVQADQFITDNTAALEANDNMPNTFPAQFTTLKEEFTDLYQQFTDAEQDTQQETDVKINANNAIHEKLMLMFEDGQIIFEDDKSLQERFIWAQVLKIVRGSRGKTRTIDIAPASREFIERVVKNSEIVNTGQVDLLVEPGNVETPGSGAITLAVEGSITRPDNNSEVSVFNTDETTAGQFTIRVTID